MTDRKTGEGTDSMVSAVWKSVEAMGIPPSSVRKSLFDLAKVIDNDPSGDILALATGAMRGVMAALEEHYKPRTALELQLEAIRTQKELHEMTGVSLPPIEFTDSDFDLQPESPVQLAQQLGYNDGGRSVRRVLRQGFPEHTRSSRWEPLTRHQVNYVRAHLPTATN